MSKTSYNLLSIGVGGNVIRSQQIRAAGVMGFRRFRILIACPAVITLAALALGFLRDRQLAARLSLYGPAYGGETGKIAASLARGEGFQWAGPTAYEAPGVPIVLAGVFQLFGINTAPARVAMLVLNCFFSAITCLVVFRIARDAFGAGIAVASAWIMGTLAQRGRHDPERGGRKPFGSAVQFAVSAYAEARSPGRGKTVARLRSMFRNHGFVYSYCSVSASLPSCVAFEP